MRHLKEDADAFVTDLLHGTSSQFFEEVAFLIERWQHYRMDYSTPSDAAEFVAWVRAGEKKN